MPIACYVVVRVEMTKKELNTRFFSTEMMEIKARMLYEEICSVEAF
jgi:hypothetical protein